MAIRIREQCWNRAATEMQSALTADKAAAMLRERGHEVDVIDGDWGSSYYADEPLEHNEVQNLQSGLIG